MPHHLRPIPDEPAEDPRSSTPSEEGPDLDPFGDDELEPIVRPSWWRWVALVVVLALVVATPFAYALHLWLG